MKDIYKFKLIFDYRYLLAVVTAYYDATTTYHHLYVSVTTEAAFFCHFHHVLHIRVTKIHLGE